MNTERKSNFELLRIIAMLGIILFHCFLHSKFTFDTSKVNLPEVSLQSLAIFGIAGNVIFTLVSGFFLINNSKLKTKKILKLILHSFTYSIIILAIFKIFHLKNLGWNDYIKSLFSISFSNNWYITFYFMLYILSPFINKLLKSLTREEYKKLLFIMFIFWCLPAVLRKSMFLNNEIVYYVFVYALGAYIRLYEDHIHINKSKSFLLLIISILFTIIFIIFFDMLGTKWDKFYIFSFEHIVRTQQSVFEFFIGLFAFLLFKNFNIKNNKIINTISSTTLGVYLIHENFLVQEFIWTDFFKLKEIQDLLIAPLYMIGICVLVYIVCIIIELIRQNLIEPLYMKLIEKYENKINKFLNYFYTLFNKVLKFQ